MLFLVFLFAKGEEKPTVNQQPQNQISEEESVLFFDRKNKLLSSASTTPGTTLLLDEVSSELSDTNELHLAIDTELQDYVYGALEDIALEKGYIGGAGVVMDIRTGELLVLTSYSQNKTSINNATNGLFIPGSIIKPFIAIAALSENIIDPKKEILSTGSIVFNENNGKKLLFKDWKAHGYVDMRKALGVSSNVYFYAIGGGYEEQRGLGIEKIIEYLKIFNIGNPTGIKVISESKGKIPTPEWKEEEFNGDEWRIADTYLASIGQHGYEITPLQMTRAVAAIATEGELVVPKIMHDTNFEIERSQIPLKEEDFKVVKEGMEYAVTNGTASGLYMDDVTLAVKTGTAEADANKEHIHSWLIGYFPSDTPRYAFTVMLHNGPWGEEIGATLVAQNIFTWIRENRKEYLHAI